MAARAEEMTFWDHLDVARGVLIRSLLYIAVATAAAWIFREQLFALLQYPALEGVHRAGIRDFAFRIFEPAGGITLMMQAALVVGLLVSSPAWLAEIVVFVTPGLHPHERRMALLLLPFAVLLFLGGAVFCYVISPAAFAFLFRFNLSLGVSPEVNLISYLHFFMRLLIVFGLVFELPLVVMFLVHFGVVTTAFLLRGWRVAIVVIAAVAAIATPTTDPFTMLLMAGPMTLLYFLSIALGRIVERRRREAEPDEEDPYGLSETPPEEPSEGPE